MTKTERDKIRSKILLTPLYEDPPKVFLTSDAFLSMCDTIDELERKVEELKEKAWKYDGLCK